MAGRESLNDALLKKIRSEQQFQPSHIETIEHKVTWLGENIFSILEEMSAYPNERLLNHVSDITGIPVISLSKIQIGREELKSFDTSIVSHFNIMPIQIAENVIVFAADKILSQENLEELNVLLNKKTAWYLCSSEELRECIKHYFGVAFKSFSVNKELPAESQTYVTKFVDSIIFDAIYSNASDVHIEPTKHSVRLRYRIDGILHTIPTPTGSDAYTRSIISSIKVMAQLNIAEKRTPQDGRFSIECDGTEIDIRVSVLPSNFGETINLRLLNSKSSFMHLKELEISPDSRSTLEEILDSSTGITLFTGPTGSGKTTSLYAALDYKKSDDRKIITIEDPIEYKINGITQMQVHESIGFSFAEGLRSILRHDPDIILVGEIRDRETAQIAIGASMTGHQVFSTLHTNDSISAVSRLIDMGIEPFLIAGSLRAVVAQRLIRKVCKICATEIPFPEELQSKIENIDFPITNELKIYNEVGCPACKFTGYKGRKPIFEILKIDSSVSKMITGLLPEQTIREYMIANKQHTLEDSAWLEVLKMKTTTQEVLRLL
jgi:type II secretory ATPase GspE/PulE/Tfp pilus assembly ATPase PilB-like protein